MSKPFENYVDKLHGAFNEIVSGNSALHMEETIIPNYKPKEDDIIFLDEKYFWVEHAKEHFKQANKLIAQVMEDRENFKWKVYKIVNKVKTKEYEPINAVNKLFDLVYQPVIEKEEDENL